MTTKDIAAGIRDYRDEQVRTGTITSTSFNYERLSKLAEALLPDLKPGDWVVGLSDAHYLSGKTCIVICAGPNYNKYGCGVKAGQISVIRPTGGTAPTEMNPEKFRRATSEEIATARTIT